MTWWTTAWAYWVPITIISPPSIDGYSHCENVSFRDGMQSDFDDVRFATDDGTVLDYWKESYTASGSAAIWVGLPAGTTSIWMYYGNASCHRYRRHEQCLHPLRWLRRAVSRHHSVA